MRPWWNGIHGDLKNHWSIAPYEFDSRRSQFNLNMFEDERLFRDETINYGKLKGALK